MTLSQIRKHALKVLAGWHRPPRVNTVTSASGVTLTFRDLIDNVQICRMIEPPPVAFVMSPEMAHRFAETTVNQSLYGTVTITCSPNLPPDTAFIIPG